MDGADYIGCRNVVLIVGHTHSNAGTLYLEKESLYRSLKVVQSWLVQW